MTRSPYIFRANLGTRRYPSEPAGARRLAIRVALLLERFAHVTLADLAADFARRHAELRHAQAHAASEPGR